MRPIVRALVRLWRAITRERAVLTGIALAILEAVSRGEVTKATAVPVIAGIVLRFFVTPSNEVPADADVVARVLADQVQAAMVTQTDNRGPADPVDAAGGELMLPQEPGSRFDG